MYAVTVQVAQCKRIEGLPSKGRSYTYYQDASKEDQMKFIEKHFMTWSFGKKVYEETPTDPKKRLHMHAVIEFASLDSYQAFVDHVYLLKTPNQSKRHLLRIEPVYDWAGWHKYLMKYQITDTLTPEEPDQPLCIDWLKYQ